MNGSSGARNPTDAANPLDLYRDDDTVRDELLADLAPSRVLRSARVGSRGSQAAPHVAGAPDPEEAVRAEPRQLLVSELVAYRDFAREQVRREQPLDEVVVAPVAVASRKAEHAADHVRVEHAAHDARRCPVLSPQSDRRAALEVERRERTLGAYPPEHLFGHLGVLGEDSMRVHGLVPPHAVPRELARREQVQPLVVRLEQLAPPVQELVAPGRVVVGDARMQHEVVVPARDRQRVELDRAEPAEHFPNGVEPSFDRARRSEQVARNEEAPGGVRGDMHQHDAIAYVPLLHTWWGLNQPIKDLANRLAGDGFTVVAPDLFDGTVLTTIEEADAHGKEMDSDY